MQKTGDHGVAQVIFDCNTGSCDGIGDAWELPSRPSEEMSQLIDNEFGGTA